jgi:hypothetical protein
MDWQENVALGIVALTVAVFVWARLRAHPNKSGCPSQCHCAPPRLAQPPPTIIYHSRKGERPTLTIKPG